MIEELKTWLDAKIKKAIKNEKEEMRFGNHTLANLWDEDKKVHQNVLDKIEELEKIKQEIKDGSHL